MSENNSFLAGIYNEHEYSSCVMMLDPGVYYIDRLSLNSKGNLHRWYPSPGIMPLSSANKDIKKYFVRIGAFEVKPGKVSYFGYLKLPDSGRFPFEMTNDSTRARADLKKKGLENLANKLEFQPFYQAGSVLVQTKEKNFFIPREEMEPRVKQYVEKVRQHLEEITTPK